ncbi:MAG: cupin domain-containing protein [Actinomycetes bacterium]
MAGGSAGHPALVRCVSVDPARFARDHWSRRALLSTREMLPSSFDDLFSPAAVDELLSRRGLRTPFIRLARDGEVTNSRRYTRPGGVGAQVGDQVADDRVLELFLDGHTIVLQGLHRLWPPVIDFAAALTTDLGHPVQVNAYVTPRSSSGFSAHYDVHDVFVLQVSGQKRWRIHEPVLRDPSRDQPWTDHRATVEARAAEEPVIDAVLRPGDALYLPRGFLHAARALGEVSIHLTVGVHPVTRQAVVEALAGLVADDPALRTSLPLGVDVSDPADLEPDVSATVEVLVARLRAMTTQDVARRLAERQVAGSRPGPIAPLAQAAAFDRLDNDSVLTVRPHLRAAVRQDGDTVEVVLPDRTLRLPPETSKALRALVDGAPLRVADLPGLDPDDALVLARRLVREAVAVVEGPAGAVTGDVAP